MSFFEPYIGQILVALAATITGWLVGRRKQKADTKKVEVEVLERALIVLEANVVEPLRKNMTEVQKEYSQVQENYKKVVTKLNKLENAINKMYACPALSDCPIRVELQKPEACGANIPRKDRAKNRQREPPGDQNNQNSNDPAGNG